MEIRKCTADLEADLTDAIIKQVTDGEVVGEKRNDVDINQLTDELEALLALLSSCMIKFQALFEYHSVSKRFAAFPNVFIAVKIYLTMPVAVASGEKSS